MCNITLVIQAVSEKEIKTLRGDRTHLYEQFFTQNVWSERKRAEVIRDFLNCLRAMDSSRRSYGLLTKITGGLVFELFSVGPYENLTSVSLKPIMDLDAKIAVVASDIRKMPDVFANAC